MSEQRWFYRTEQEWAALVERFKRIACPHCHRVGALIRHGSLFGFDDQSLRRRTRRARRIFCSNRYRQPGCGRTITAWFAEKIRRSSLTTPTVWAFLQRAVQGGLADAIRTMKSPLSNRTWQRC